MSYSSVASRKSQLAQGFPPACAGSNFQVVAVFLTQSTTTPSFGGEVGTRRATLPSAPTSR